MGKYRPFIHTRHRLDHLLVEQFRHGADTDDGGRLNRLNRCRKGTHRRMVMRERFLKVREIRTRGHHQAVDVEQPFGRPASSEMPSIAIASPISSAIPWRRAPPRKRSAAPSISVS